MSDDRDSRFARQDGGPWTDLAEVTFLPDFFAVDAQKLVPVGQRGGLVGRAKQSAFRDAVEAPGIVRRLPAQVDAPAHFVRLVLQTAAHRRHSTSSHDTRKYDCGLTQSAGADWATWKPGPCQMGRLVCRPCGPPR